MKAQVTIEIPEGYELAEPEMRKATYGEPLLTQSGVETWLDTRPTKSIYPILRKVAWKPKIGDKYYAISSPGEALYLKHNGLKYDEHLFAMGNYFRTMESAKRAAEKVRNLLLSIPDEER